MEKSFTIPIPNTKKKIYTTQRGSAQAGLFSLLQMNFKKSDHSPT